MLRKQYRRSLKVERLEERQLMAGDVTATFTNSTLTLTGDLNDNGILITGLVGQIQVTGIEQGGLATTVNGSYRATYNNVRQIVVDLGSGDDALVATNGSIVGVLPGLGLVGVGSSITTVGSAGVATSLSINMGDGNDLVGLGQFDNTTDELIFGTEKFKSWVDKEVDSLLGPLALSQQVTLDLGNGDNELRARAVTIGRGLTIVGGSGEDKLSLQAMGAPSDDDYLPGVNVKLDTTISTGAGKDEVLVDRFSTRGMNLTAGAGDDTVKLENVVVTKNTTISGDDGHDAIRLEGFSTVRLNLNAGAGDDDVYLKTVIVKSNSIVDGGGGDDIYHDLGGNTLAKLLRISNFETIIGSQVKSKQIGRSSLFV